jgi:hypothetical protein
VDLPAHSFASRIKHAPVPAIAAGLAFVLLYGGVLLTLVGDWWHDPDAGHGLLLAIRSARVVLRRVAFSLQPQAF